MHAASASQLLLASIKHAPPHGAPVDEQQHREGANVQVLAHRILPNIHGELIHHDHRWCRFGYHLG